MPTDSFQTSECCFGCSSRVSCFGTALAGLHWCSLISDGTPLDLRGIKWQRATPRRTRSPLCAE